MKELFVFFQFNGDNRCVCQLKCPECYGRKNRTNLHYWNGDVGKWERAFERLNRDIYFVFSYGEALISKGFYECVGMIGDHPNWTLNIITNLMANPERLLESKLAKENRLFLNPCWHPEGVDDIARGWEVFKKHLLMVKDAGVAVHVMMVWMPFVIKRFPEYFEWLDKHDFRVGVRRFVYDSFWSKVPFVRSRFSFVAGKCKLMNYSEAERGFIYAYTGPKVTKYGLDLANTRGRTCHAGKDMILVKYDGTVTFCAGCYGSGHGLGNIFDSNFKLNDHPIRCPTNSCGGDFGMFVLEDERFGELPKRMWRDTFISQVEGLKQSSPVAYPKREEMLKWLEKIKCEK